MNKIRAGIYIMVILVGILIFYYFCPEEKLDASRPIDKILVLKSKRSLTVYSKGEALKTYTISLGLKPIGAKQFEGDFKTPEGNYIIDTKNPHSSYHKNLGISYPSKANMKYAKSKGKEPGGLIKIHGIKNGMGFIAKFHRWKDWTHGCIAITNDEMDELYKNIKIGTPIEIRP
jgi:murein L,D-transpeptidase YafK